MATSDRSPLDFSRFDEPGAEGITPDAPPAVSSVAEMLVDPNARLSDYSTVLRALNDGFLIPDEVKALAVTATRRLLEDANPRRAAKGVQFAIAMQKSNVDLIKMGHADLAAVEKERRAAVMAGRLPAQQGDAPDSVTKQPVLVSLENFVGSLPPLRIRDEAKAKRAD